jgi:hypothetical protein
VHPILEKAWIELTNVDSRFATPLLLSVVREGDVTEEYETTLHGQRAQKFPVQPGAVSFTVVPIPKANAFPVPGTLPIWKETVTLAPGEMHSIPLYPR